MTLNHTRGGVGEVVLHPGDGGDPGGFRRRGRRVLPGEGSGGEGREGEELPGLGLRLGFAEASDIVGDADDGSRRRWPESGEASDGREKTSPAAEEKLRHRRWRRRGRSQIPFMTSWLASSHHFVPLLLFFGNLY